ncbi:LysR family transcriptional regulator [Photobacterium sanctipauli]|uniref:LysR family transcriptional regulator n=1 Tax=Photobacterium sanctipauli TaxID=1342794 RepID=A0A2T3P118_9GAMM|nr:LysR family transcriptional regulator [Photobacterium sanctipauli]PSW22223.1 LysR family transcriptional regulator [Photobacterium sanctipauli]
MIDIPNLRHLNAFVEVANTQSISKASERIFLSQPAITQAISKLEKSIKTNLFERRSDGMYLTDAGEGFSFRVQRALEQINNGIKDAVRIGKGDKKTLANSRVIAVTTTQLRALLAVSEAQNYTEAGRRIGVSQSSLYRASRELEDCLDLVLFEKTSIGICISKAGQSLVRATKLAFSEIRQGLDEITSNNNTSSGNIVVGSMPLARTCILPDAINEFTDQYPDCTIQIIDGPYQDLLYHLRNGEIDVLIGALRFPTPVCDIKQETLFASPNSILVRKDHPLASQNEVSLEELAKQSWIVPRQNTPAREMFDDIFIENNCAQPTQIIEASSQALIRELLLGSDKLALLSKHQAYREIEENTLTVIPFPLANKERPIGITLRKNWQATTPQEHFIHLLREKGLAFSGIQ